MNNTNEEQLNNGINQGVTPAVPAEPVVPTASATPTVEVPATPVVETPAPVAPVAPAPEVPAPAPVEAPVQPESPAAPAVANMNHVETVKQIDKDIVDVSQTQNTVSLDTLRNVEKDEKKIEGGESNRKFPIFLVLLIVGFIVFIGIYYFVIVTPKNVFDALLNKTYDALASVVENDEGLKAVTLDNDVELNITKANYTLFNPIKLKANLGYDFNENKALTELALSLKEQEFLKYDKYNTIDTAYYKAGEMLVKQVIQENDEGAGRQDMSPTDWLYLLKALKDSLIETVDENQMTRSFDGIEVNGTMIFAVKVKYEVTPEESQKVFDAVLNKALSDEKIITILANYLGITDQEMKYLLQNMVGKLSFDNTVNVYAYVNIAGTELKRFDFEYKEIKVTIMGHNELYSIDFSTSLGEILNTKVNLNLDLDINIVESKMNGKITFVMNERNYIVNIASKIKTNNGILTIESVLENFEPDMKDSSAKLEISTTVTPVEELPFPDVTTAVDINVLPPETQQMILNPLSSLGSLLQFQ